MNNKITESSRYGRRFLKNTVKTAIGTAAPAHFQAIVPARVLGKCAPGHRINTGVIETAGSIGREWYRPPLL